MDLAKLRGTVTNMVKGPDGVSFTLQMKGAVLPVTLRDAPVSYASGHEVMLLATKADGFPDKYLAFYNITTREYGYFPYLKHYMGQTGDQMQSVIMIPFGGAVVGFILGILAGTVGQAIGLAFGGLVAGGVVAFLIASQTGSKKNEIEAELEKIRLDVFS